MRWDKMKTKHDERHQHKEKESVANFADSLSIAAAEQV